MGTWADIERLVAACEEVFCSDVTEKHTGTDRYEMEPCSDDEGVMAGVEGDDTRLTFGMIRRAREAVNTLR